MKQQIVPTSPKSPHKQQREENREYRVNKASRPHVIFALLFSSLIIGTCAGFAGFFVAANIPSDWPVLGQYNIREMFQTQKETVFLSTAEQEKSVVEEAPQVIEQTVAIYDVLPETGAEAKLLGNAVVLTSDGWIVAPRAVFPKDNALISNVVVILEDGTTPEIVQTEIDTKAQLVFLQLDADTLSPVEFTEGTELATGQWVTVLEQRIGRYGVFERRIARSGVAAVRDLQSPPIAYELDTVGEKHQTGAGVYTSDGKLVGVVQQNGQVLHAASIQGQLQALLETSQIQQFEDDVTYVQLSIVPAAEREANELPESGIWIVDAGISDVLQNNDVVTAINNVVVTDSTDLSTALRSKAAGSTFLLGITRKGENQVIEYSTRAIAK